MRGLRKKGEVGTFGQALPLCKHAMHNRVSARGGAYRGTVKRCKPVSEWGHEGGGQTDRQRPEEEGRSKRASCAWRAFKGSTSCSADSGKAHGNRRC